MDISPGGGSASQAVMSSDPEQRGGRTPQKHQTACCSCRVQQRSIKRSHRIAAAPQHTGLMGNDRLLFLKTYSYIYPLTWVFLPRVSRTPSMHRDISGNKPAQRPFNLLRRLTRPHTHTHTQSLASE